MIIAATAHMGGEFQRSIHLNKAISSHLCPKRLTLYFVISTSALTNPIEIL